uniref:Uncharacterized protein ORF1179 n=1 Tax=Mycobacterium avium TaxID=1764 RepID=Q9RQT0_MYCAV|nr:unknown [Mycobacterium avium]
MSQQVWAGVDAGSPTTIAWLSMRRVSDCCQTGSQRRNRTAGADRRSSSNPTREVTWAIDLNAGWCRAADHLAHAAEQRALHPRPQDLPRSAGYRGDGKSDAKDAAVIADQARMRRDLQPLRPGDDIAVELRILTAGAPTWSSDRTRVINRLRAQLLEYFPALERGFDYSASKAALILLTGYQTPDGCARRAARLTAWLHKRKARNASAVAATAIEARQRQHTTVPGQNLAAAMVARLAKEVMTLDTEIAETDTMIEDRFRRHRHAEILLSMPGFGVILGAEFLAATAHERFRLRRSSCRRVGLAPVPRDSGRISGNLKRPRRYDRRLLRACYLSAQIAIRTDPASRTYYNRKRAEGKTHTQSILALARRRLNVLWAMLRDHAVYQPATTTAAA